MTMLPSGGRAAETVVVGNCPEEACSDTVVCSMNIYYFGNYPEEACSDKKVCSMNKPNCPNKLLPAFPIKKK